tara:strand:- start:9171 stop:10316 length:1146 start_codon:yes stop_codon:yes gene_type:complete
MLELFFSAFGAGTCIVLMMLLLKDFSHANAARAFFVLIFGAFVSLCHNWLPSSLHVYAYMIESVTPAFFWISCRLIFQEGKSLPRIGLVIAIFSIIAPVLRHLITLSLGMTPQWVEFIGREVQQYCEYALIIMGIVALLRGREDDMVESRRRLRWAIMGAAGLSLGWSIFSFNLNFGSDASRIFAIDLSLLVIVWFLVKGRSDIWGGVKLPKNTFGNGSLTAGFTTALTIDRERAQVANGVVVGVENTLIEQVNNEVADSLSSIEEVPLVLRESETLIRIKAIMQEGFYRRENLTLKDLSNALEVPEYKVRAAINKELGYRNFNEFINEYRIKEAAKRLRDEPETPISNIALDVGYRTLSSFNRAFRKEKDTTPTAFREGY